MPQQTATEQELLFELRSIAYCGTRSDKDFESLLTVERPLRAGVIDVVCRPSENTGDGSPSAKHLASALASNDRNLEAIFYCTKWAEVESQDFSPWRTLFLLACKVIDSERAYQAFEQLKGLDAPEGMIQTMELCYLLAFKDGKGARAVARTMLDCDYEDPMSLPVAMEAAVRLEEPELLVEILLRAPSLAEDKSRRGGLAKSILRRKLVNVLSKRGDSSCSGS